MPVRYSVKGVGRKKNRALLVVSRDSCRQRGKGKLAPNAHCPRPRPPSTRRNSPPHRCLFPSALAPHPIPLHPIQPYPTPLHPSLPHPTLPHPFLPHPTLRWMGCLRPKRPHVPRQYLARNRCGNRTRATGESLQRQQPPPTAAAVPAAGEKREHPEKDLAVATPFSRMTWSRGGAGLAEAATPPAHASAEPGKTRGRGKMLALLAAWSSSPGWRGAGSRGRRRWRPRRRWCLLWPTGRGAWTSLLCRRGFLRGEPGVCSCGGEVWFSAPRLGGGLGVCGVRCCVCVVCVCA